MAIRVTCITKEASEPGYPHTGICTLGWVEDDTLECGIYSRIEMYLWLVNGGHAYIQAPSGHKKYLIAMQTDKGTHYVRTTRDAEPEDDLLNLPDRPSKS